MNKLMFEELADNSNYSLDKLPLNFSDKNEQIGKISMGKLFRMVKVFFKLLGHLIKKRPEVVVFNYSSRGLALFRDFIYLSLLKIFKVPVTLYIQISGVNERGGSSGFYHRIYQSSFKKVQVICLSHRLKKDISNYYKEEPFVLPNTIPLLDFEGGKTRTPKILFLSNLMAEKGLPEFLQNLKLINDILPSNSVDIVGKEADLDEEWLKGEIDRLGLKSKVSYLGPKYGKEKDVSLTQSTIFAFPSQYEAFPLVLLEAMQAGLAIVAYDVGGIGDIVEDGLNGFLIKKGDNQVFTKKLKFLMNNPDVASEMGKASVIRYNQKFSLLAYRRNLNSIFDALEKR